MRALLVALALLAAAAGPAPAALDPAERLADPALEARARAITRQLRCVVCQNQSIDDSNAELARDLRRLVRERIAQGDSDSQVLAFVVARYGDYVLLRPPLTAGTLALWFGPAALLLAGGAFLFVRARRRAAAGAAPPPLSAEEARRVAALVGDTTDGRAP
jgi:cytochrome c-type biogenesis protein CcmH